jgi:toxin ParE1/3/4
MAKLKWTDKALKDLEDIGEFISKDSLRYAYNTVQKLFKSVEILKLMPKTGRIVPELSNNNIRELIRGNYRIIYLVKDDTNIEILTIHHSARFFNLE